MKVKISPSDIKKYKLFRRPLTNEEHGVYPGYNIGDTHIIFVETVIWGNTYASSPKTLQPRDLKLYVEYSLRAIVNFYNNQGYDTIIR